MKRFFHRLAASLLLISLLAGMADPGILPTAEAATAKTTATIVTWDKRTVKPNGKLYDSDNGQEYGSELTIRYSNADKVRVRLLDPKGKVVSKQDKTWKVKKQSGSLKWSVVIPKGSTPGVYKVRVTLTKGKKTTTCNFTWRVYKYVHTAKPSKTMQKQFDYLKSKLPQGKYWNHGVNGAKTVTLNNGYTTTISSSRCTSWSHKGDNWESPYASCNHISWGYQCHGFALLLAYYVWGSIPDYDSRVTAKSAAERLEPGDVVRFLNDQHTFFVLKVVKDTVYYADCNWGNTCRIRWNGKITVKQLKKTFSYVMRYKDRVKY